MAAPSDVLVARLLYKQAVNRRSDTVEVAGWQVYSSTQLPIGHRVDGTLHKDPHGKPPFWYAAYTTAPGERVFKFTKRNVHREALDLEWAEREASSGRLSEARIHELLVMVPD